MRKCKLFCATALLAFVMLFAAFTPSMAAANFKVNMSTSMPNNKVGTTVSISASVPGATAASGYQYKFVWAKPNWKPWGVIQDFSASNKATFNPPSAGTYEVYVDVKDKSGNIVTTKKSFNITMGWTPSLTTTASTKVGNPITAKGAVSGVTNKMKYKYKFVWTRNNSWAKGNWGVIQNFGDANTATFTPPKAGTYKIYMDVKDQYGNIITKQSSNYTVALGWSTKMSLSAADTRVGTPITAKASVVNPNPNLKYKYKFVWSLNNWQKWGVIQDFSDANSATFTPPKAGNYQIYVDIKDNFGNIVTKNMARNAVLSWSGNLSLSAANTNVGTPITAKASVSNPHPNMTYKYKFVWCRNGSWAKDNWGVIQDFGDANTATFTPPKAGNYQIYVDIKDNFGNIITKNLSRKAVLSWSPSLSLSAANTKVGTPINATAGVTKPHPNMTYTYKFVWCRNGSWDKGNWGVIQNFSSNNKATYTPTKPGTYNIYADVKDNFGNIVTKNVARNVVLGWSPSLSVKVPSTRVGTTITAIGSISGLSASNPCQYKFVWSRNNWDEWGVIQDFSDSNKITYTPKLNGKYDIYMDVKDKYGNIVTKTSSFTLYTDWRANTPSVSLNGSLPGSTATITANISKSVPNAKYKFVWSLNNWQQWGVIKDFSTTRTVKFTPTQPGNYTIYTDIKDAAGNINTATKSFTINPKGYKLIINLNTQTISAHPQNYDGSYGAAVRRMPCSTGRSRGATPTGTFNTKAKYRWHMLNGGVWGQWCTRIVGGVLFHTVPHRTASNMTVITKYYNQLGSPASAGCVRVRAVDAKWIYDNCSVGTPVQIGYFNSTTYPKAYARKVKSTTTWDPTDPTLSSSYYDKGWQ